MAKGKQDPETGVTPKATDGDPGDEERMQAELDELAARRAQANQEGNVNGSAGRPIDDQDIPIDEEDDGQLFVWEQGRKVTLGTLVARGTTVEHAFVFGGKRMKGAGGLVGMDDDVLMIVRGRMSATKIVPTRDDDERVTKVTIETHIAAKVVAPADSEHGVDLIRGVLERRGIKAA